MPMDCIAIWLVPLEGVLVAVEVAVAVEYWIRENRNLHERDDEFGFRIPFRQSRGELYDTNQYVRHS